MTDAPQIFLSYRRDDSRYSMDLIYGRLKERLGEKAIFVDIHNIPLGVNFPAEIKQRVSQCIVLLAIIGPNWTKITDKQGRRRLDNPKDFVRLEVESALARKIPVVPLLVDEAKVPEESELPGRLKKIIFRNGMAIRPGLDFDNDMDRLIKELEKYLPNVEKSLPIPVPSSPSPAVGKNSIEGFLSKFADLEFVGKVAVGEFLCFASMLLSIWIAGVYMVPLTAGADQIILYALGFSGIITALLMLFNWRMRYDNTWISTVGGSTLLAIIWAFVVIIF